MYPEEPLKLKNEWGSSMTAIMSQKGITKKEIAKTLGVRPEYVAAVISGSKASKTVKARMEALLK